MSASGKLPSNGNGEDWKEREDTGTRHKLRVARDEWAAEARTKTTSIIVGAVMAVGGLGGLVGVIAFGLGRAAASDVQAHDVRLVRVEKDSEIHHEQITEVKGAVDKVDNKLDVVLDQLRPMAVRQGAPIVPRPPRAAISVIKPAPPEEIRP